MNILIEDAEKLEILPATTAGQKKASEGKNFGATEAAFQVAKKEPIGRFNMSLFTCSQRNNSST